MSEQSSSFTSDAASQPSQAVSPQPAHQEAIAVEAQETVPSQPQGWRGLQHTTAHGARVMAIVAVVVLIADQLTKLWAVAALSDGTRIPVLGDALSFVLLRNPGAAFSFATGQTWIFTIVAVVVSALTIRVARRLRSLWWAMTLGLVLGGAVGNLIDRLVRSPGIFRGHVIDFIDYGGWFVGNVADIAIVVAAAVIVLLCLCGIELDATRAAQGKKGEKEGESTRGEQS